MRVEWRTILGASVFLLATCIVYAVLIKDPSEQAGVMMLLFGGAAYLMLGGFLVLQWMRRKKIPRPEDRDDGTYAEVAGEPIAFFPSASIWPAGIGLGATSFAVGLVWGNWYLLIAIPLLFGAIIGFAVESEAGFEVQEHLTERE
ncbi:MAG: aa3-type cytochrome oxidase subunit IV, partial [Acidimicrobiales bacterium]